MEGWQRGGRACGVGLDPRSRKARDLGHPSSTLFLAGGPFKPFFDLSGAFRAEQSLAAAVSWFRVVYSDSMATVPHSRVTSQRKVPPLHRLSLCDDLFPSG